ncbi:hypothetical protein phiCTP1_gp79 [Clostridium phage phiCTP1]|uniref:hypothetical protein n=1 Tax=Clostridium phage phiCTP1 TaxID=871584 RepID=UPI0001E07860|nr:hypothetical protein phiCTP1_gp79 [Clostridium phage phiCTP1]ADL40380.1 hypothetical phage protein [Clostridium phage phiCTP1]WMU08012.1 hypothetical protein vBCtySFA88_00080 [Clostridium phage vB_CtyS-FA88]
MSELNFNQLAGMNGKQVLIIKDDKEYRAVVDVEFDAYHHDIALKPVLEGNEIILFSDEDLKDKVQLLRISVRTVK